MGENFLKKVADIEKRLKRLKNQLRKIPEQRELICPIKEINKEPLIYIYKLRFKPKEKPIPQKLKKKFNQVIDDTNFYLKKYSPENFANLSDIIDITSNNKKSILFLLEKDVYQTDEVYGEYLVEKHTDHYEIYYHRWKEKKKKLQDQEFTTDLKRFINQDAILQIQTRLDQLWDTLEYEIERCKNHYLSLKNVQNEERINQIKKLLETKECEYLDFKNVMYKVLSKDNRTKLEQSKEFLKDVLSLVNNEKREGNTVISYIIIGVDETNQKYNGTHQNIEFTNYQILIQLINDHITPKLSIEFEEYYISEDQNNILISNKKEQGFDRNLIIKLYYEIGIVYEIKRKIGNPNLKVKYYNEGTSFTRDGSHTRRMNQEDRKKIMRLSVRHKFNVYEIEDYEEEEILRQELIEKTPELKIDIELINKYITMLKKKELSKENVIELLSTILGEIHKLRFYENNDQKIISIFKKFVEFSHSFIQNKETEIVNKILYMLRELTFIPEIVKLIKDNCYEYLREVYLKDNRNKNLIYVLNSCGFFENIVQDIVNAIDERDIALLEVIINFDFDNPKIISKKYSIIEKLIDKKEELDIHNDNNLIQYIQQIIRKVEKLK